jgi:tetratricopeptide (TPR) repeat protein
LTEADARPEVRRDAAALAAIFALALGLRLFYLAQVEPLPSFEHLLVDARSYDEWAQRIAAGDWLGDRVFYQAPAYPYFLALLYSAFDRDLHSVHVLQMGLGALACVLLALATKRIFGRAAGFAAGLLMAAYAPALFFDGLIEKTGLGLFLTALLLVCLTGFAARPAAARGALAGFIVGLLALTRENALIFALAIPAWMLWQERRTGKGGARNALPHVAAFALGLALVLLPVGFRNLAIGDTFAITTSQLGPNFYIGNNPQATGLYAPLLPGRQTPDFEGSDAARAAEWETGRELSPGEVSSFWLGRSLDWISENPGTWLALLLQKLLFTINDYEIPDTEDIYVHAEFSWLLAGLHALFRFGVLLPLALAGMVFAFSRETAVRERSAAVLLAGLAVLFAAAVAVFYVWARYRFPLVPLLVPFAGLALVESFACAGRGEWRRLVAPGAALATAALLSNATLLDRELLSQSAWVNLGNIMIRERRFEEAEQYLTRAGEIPHESADLHFHFAALRFQQGRKADAEQHLRRMLELDATDFRGHRLLAQLLREQGRRKEANLHLRESVRLDPGRARKGRPGAPIPVPEPERELEPEGEGVDDR